MKKIIRNIIASFLGLIIVILGYFVIANIVATKNNTIASFFGYSITYVPTESMEPTIKTNSTIMFEKNTKYDDLKVGDIIVYHNDETNMYIIHRIKEETNSGFIMQGDNNPIPDRKSVVTENVYGKVLFVIPKLGYIQTYLSSPIHVLICLLIPIVVIVLYDFIRIVLALQKSKSF